MTNTNRRSFIEQILGKSTSDELKKSVTGLQAVLDKAGVQRKEYKEKGLLEDVAVRVDEMLAELTDGDVTGIRNRVIAEVVAMMGGMESYDDDVEEEDVLEEETMMGGEEDEEMRRQVMELSQQVKSLAEESHSVNEGLLAMIPAFTEGMEVMRELVPLINKAQRLDEALTRMEKIERQLAQTPRRASTAAETVVTDDKVKLEIEKGAKEQKVFLGIPLQS